MTHCGGKLISAETYCETRYPKEVPGTPHVKQIKINRVQTQYKGDTVTRTPVHHRRLST